MNLSLLPDGIPYLSILWLVLLLGALVCAALPRTAVAATRLTATLASGLAVVLALLIFLAYNPAGLTFQRVERLPWIPDFGISYFVAVDGLSVPMLLLATVAVLCGVLLSWSVEQHAKERYVLLLAMGVGLIGAVIALDALLLVIGVAIAVVAAFLLTAITTNNASHRAITSTVALLGGLFAVLIGILAIYFAGGQTFNLIELAQNNDWSVVFQTAAFVPLFLGFAVIAGLFPFHGWVPHAIGSGSSPVALLVGGVLVGLGGFGLVRVALWLLPAGAVVWSPILMALALLSLLYGSVQAFLQRDLGGIFSHATIARSGLVVFGIAVANNAALDGAALLLFAQGLTLTLFFSIVAMVVARTGSGNLDDLGEIGRILPFIAAAAIIASFSLVGVPSFTSFLGSLTITQGAWARYPVAAIVAVVGMLLTVAYLLRVMRTAFFGAAKNTAVARFNPLTQQEYVVGSLLVILIVGSVFVLHPLSLAGVGPVTQRLNDAQTLVQSVGNPFFGR